MRPRAPSIQVSQPRLRQKFGFRFVRATLLFLAFISRTNITARHRDLVTLKALKRSHPPRGASLLGRMYFRLNYGLLKPLKLSTWEEELRRYICGGSLRFLYYLPEFVILFNVAACVHLALLVYWKYPRDFIWLKLETLKASNGNTTLSIHLEREISELSSRLDYLNDILHSLGNPHGHIGFLPQWVYGIEISNWTITMSLLYYYRCVNPIYFPFARGLVDFHREQIYIKSLVKNELVRCISYFTNFREIFQNLSTDNPFLVNCSNVFTNHKFSCPPKLDDLLRRNSRLLPGKTRFKIYQLIRYYEEDLLLPMDKTVDWIDSLANRAFVQVAVGMYYMVFVYSVFIYPIYFDSFALLDDQQHQIKILQRTNFRLIDFMVDLEVILLLFFSYVIIFLQALGLQIGNDEEVRFVEKLSQSIGGCKRVNMLAFQEYQRNFLRELPSSQREQQIKERGQSSLRIVMLNQSEKFDSYSQIRDEINGNLMLVIIHFRIYKERFSLELKHTLRTFIFALSASLMIAILSRLNGPFMDRLEHNHYFPRGYMFMALMAIDVLLLPFCHLHRKSENLYKDLSQLLAHTQLLDQLYAESFDTLLEENDNTKSLGPMYDKGIISILHRELSDPNSFRRHFVVESCGLACTYGDVLKVHFWLGLASLSLLCGQDLGSDELLSRLFA